MGKPAEEFCPIAGPDTEAPVSSPVQPPVIPPPTNVTEAPFTAPVEAPVMPPSCPPFESYEPDDESAESPTRDIKGVSSTSGVRDSKGKTEGVTRSSKNGAPGVGNKGQTESTQSRSSKTRRGLATGGGHCPEPTGGKDDSGITVTSKGGSSSKGSSVSNSANKSGSIKRGPATEMEEERTESIPEHGMSKNKTESESEPIPSKKADMKARRLRPLIVGIVDDRHAFV